MLSRLPLRIGLVLALAGGIVWALTHRQLLDAGTIASIVNALGVWAPAAVSICVWSMDMLVVILPRHQV